MQMPHTTSCTLRAVVAVKGIFVNRVLAAVVVAYVQSVVNGMNFKAAVAVFKTILSDNQRIAPRLSDNITGIHVLNANALYLFVDGNFGHRLIFWSYLKLCFKKLGELCTLFAGWEGEVFQLFSVLGHFVRDDLVINKSKVGAVFS